MNKYIACLLSVCFCSTTIAPANASEKIPNSFHGKWAEKKKCHFFSEVGTPDGGVDITGTEVNFYENYCKLKNLTKRSPKLLSGSFICAVEGEESEHDITIKLNDRGQLSYGNSLPLQKCDSTPAKFSPSFDCLKASTKAEKLICANENIASLDVQLLQAYKKLLDGYKDPKALKKEQKEWVKNTRDVCTSVDCMVKAYNSRIEDLESEFGYLSKPAEFR